MSATNNSPYQVILQAHISGSPPDCDPQRSYETFNSYQIRMNGHGFNPDIGLTESDSAYLARLAGYTNTPPSPAKLWSYMTLPNTNSLASSSIGCNVVRISAGNYGVTFNNPLNNSNYAVFFSGFSGSTSSPTASNGYSIAQTTLNFTMSTFLESSALTAADFATGSFLVINS